MSIVDQALRGNADSFDTVRKLGALSQVISGEDAVDSVIASDKVLFTMSESVAVAEGASSEQDAFENLIDRAAVYVTVWAQQKCVELCEAGGALLGAKIGAIFGPKGSEIGAKIGKWLGNKVGNTLKPVVEKGVQLIANVAKTVWGTVKSVVSSICNTVASWLGF